MKTPKELISLTDVVKKLAVRENTLPYLLVWASRRSLLKFSELQMRRSLGGGAQSGAALFKKLLFVNYNKNF
jgi:hypothetical protein